MYVQCTIYKIPAKFYSFFNLKNEFDGFIFLEYQRTLSIKKWRYNMKTLIPTNEGKQHTIKPLLKDFFDIDPFFGGSWLSKWENKMPAVNISETEKDFIIDVIAPGFLKEDFKLNINDDVITIDAEAKSEENDETKDYTRREYHFNSFTRSFRLPENVKAEAIEAAYHNGILQILMPKIKIEKKAVKNIPIN